MKKVVGAFIIMNTEYGHHQLLGLADKECKLLGHQIQTKRAAEPYDIIWKNIKMKKQDIYKRLVIALSVLGITLMIYFSVMIWIKRYAGKFLHKYPQVDCQSILSEYSK